MKKLSIIHRIYMPQAELEKYHRTLRKYEYEHHIQVSGLKARQFFYKLVRGLILIESACSKVNVKVIGDDSVHTEKPIIYVWIDDYNSVDSTTHIYEKFEKTCLGLEILEENMEKVE